MVSLSYNISFELRKNLNAIDSLRQKILLTPTPPRYEHKLKWDSMIRRLRYTFLLRGDNLNNSTVVKWISQTTPTVQTRTERDLVSYKRALDYLAEEWVANPSPVTIKILRGLFNMVTPNTATNTSQFSRAEEELKHLLEYLQSRPDHPVVLSAIVYIKILDILPSVQNNDLVAQLGSLLFLYKYGFDVKGFVECDEYWYKNLRTYKNVVADVLNNGKLNMWLEYYAYSIAYELTRAAQLVGTPPEVKDPVNRMWKLTDRQKEILRRVQEPGSTITNRSVQKLFKISQITASRDLARLASLGLLLTHGKGRSVYYIKS